MADTATAKPWVYRHRDGSETRVSDHGQDYRTLGWEWDPEPLDQETGR